MMNKSKNRGDTLISIRLKDSDSTTLMSNKSLFDVCKPGKIFAYTASNTSSAL